jgi:hypothetical protein
MDVRGPEPGVENAAYVREAWRRDLALVRIGSGRVERIRTAFRVICEGRAISTAWATQVLGMNKRKLRSVPTGRCLPAARRR